MNKWINNQIDLAKEVVEIFKGAFFKALITMVSGLIAFVIVTVAKVYMNGNRMHELCLIIVLLAVPVGISLWYLIKPNEERKSEASFSRTLTREAMRSTLNSLLVFYIGFEVYYSWLGGISNQIDGYYDTLSEFERQRVVIYEPFWHIAKTIGFYACISVLFNSLYNYITADAERNKKALPESSESQEQSA